MKKIKSEKGSITVFVIVAFIFCMTILVNIYWSSTNYQITVLQAQQRIKDIYGKDVNNVEQIYKGLGETTIVL
ncbi:MAG: hypothetical protein HFJ54_07500 [Clostridia bacterium]|nr:hypothetical protein [Clostridia bacterium]